MASLTPEVATKIRDLILRLPESDPYVTLIKRTAVSEQRRFQQLLQAEELGNRKPTQLLRCMLQLLGDKAPVEEIFLRELFMQRLPNNVSMVLAPSTDSTPLNNLAELADRVMDVAGPTSASVSYPSMATAPAPPLGEQVQAPMAVSALKPSSADFERILDELAKLQATVSMLTKANNPTCSCSRHCSPAPSSSPSRRYCWYHQKFGDDARKFVSPCSYPNEAARR